MTQVNFTVDMNKLNSTVATTKVYPCKIFLQMWMSNMLKLEVVRLKRRNFSYNQIIEYFIENFDFTITKAALHRFYTYFRRTGLLSKKKQIRPTKFTQAHLQLIEDSLRSNPELTSPELAKLVLETTGLKISTSCIKANLKAMGWTQKKTRYCQLIRYVKVKVGFIVSNYSKIEHLSTCVTLM